MLDLRFQSIETPLPAPKGGRVRAIWKRRDADNYEDLAGELKHLKATSAILLIDLPREKIRMDGWPMVNAAARSPGIRLSFETPAGPMAYTSNRYTTWQGNLRAIVLTLQRLRLVDDYGCAQGGQYAGFRALPAGEGARAGDGFRTAEDAAGWMIETAGLEPHCTTVQNVVEYPAIRQEVYRKAARACHPDSGGTDELFARLQRAKDLLDSGGAS